MSGNTKYIKRMADCYEAGDITHNDFGCMFLRTVTEEDVSEAFKSLSNHLKSVVIEKALEYGHTVTAYTAGYNYRGNDMAAYERNRKLEGEKYARGVKAVRKLIDDYCKQLWGY